MRAYLTGVTSTSIWTHYRRAARTLLRPRSARRHEEEPAAAEGDPDAVDEGREGRPRRVGVARRDPRDGRAVGAPTSTRAAEMCARAVRVRPAARRCGAGLILVDTKYEIGRRARRHARASSTRSTRPTRRATGTPTTTRRASPRGEEPRGLDKEYVRRTLADQGYQGDGPPPKLTRRRPRRGGAPLHPGLRARHRPPVRARTPTSRARASGRT